MEQDSKLTKAIAKLLAELNSVKQDLADMKAKCDECKHNCSLAIKDCKTFEENKDD